eukprot:804982-Pelagomonas_calceolata.AAC.4
MRTKSLLHVLAIDIFVIDPHGPLRELLQKHTVQEHALAIGASRRQKAPFACAGVLFFMEENQINAAPGSRLVRLCMSYNGKQKIDGKEAYATMRANSFLMC